jgi:hypothetical protein
VSETVHVFSGDVAAARWREAGGTGATVVWREALVAGPLGAPPASPRWLDERVAFLGAYAGVGPEACRRDLERQRHELTGALDADEVVLWFARDLFCELALACVLQAIGAQARRPRRLSLVHPAESGTRAFPCFGALEPAAVRALFPGRRDIGDADLRAARVAWDALAAPSPERLDALAAGGGLFASALRKQRARFPALGDGLGATERAALRALGDAPVSLAAVLASVGAALPDHGWTDVQVEAELAALAAGPAPLVVRTQAGFAITADGRAVLAGAADRVVLCPPDAWIGGVRLAGRPWRWDADGGRLVPPR